MATETVTNTFEIIDVTQPIEGNSCGKNLLSITQFSGEDIREYIDDAYAAEVLVDNPLLRGRSILPRAVLKAIMQQPSTRTGGSCTTAMQKLGGSADLISGMSSSSEAKGESPEDSWIAFATQADILGIRTKKDWEPMQAATAIAYARATGQLKRTVPVINLGDGTNEHPTQALGDMFTIHKQFGQFKGLVAAVVGDHERYRAHHSFMLAAAALGMSIIAVEAKCSPVQEHIVHALGSGIERTNDLDEAMSVADILYIGRNPDEYTNIRHPKEFIRSLRLARAYKKWKVDIQRIQKMPKDSIVMHPRPRRDELNPNVDSDPRMRDIQQMANMIPMRMAIFARHLGVSIVGGD